ncbi:PTS transporter subunit EIIC [Erysipelotrichaceae bacterium 51-3]
MIMEKISSFLEAKLVPMTDKITNNRYVKVLMDSFMGISGLTIGASFFTLVRSLPLGEGYTNFLINTGLYEILNFPIMITSELISLYLIVTIGYFLAKSFNKKPINGALIALGSFLMVTPFEVTATLTDAAGNEVTGIVANVLSVSSFGATGIFLAMIVGLLSVRVYVYFDDKGFKLHMPASVPENVTNMFETMIPASMVFILFMIVRVACSYTTFGTAQNLIYGLLQAPLTNIGGGYWGAFLYLWLGLIFWIFGIHGSMLMYVAMGSIAQAMWAENMAAFASGLPAPHPEWLYMYFVNMGGSGATFGLVLLMCFLAKSEHLKVLGRVALPTSIFNINEPVIFGTPLVMNPTLAIPFLVAPAVNFFLTSLVNTMGFAILTGAMQNNYYPVGILGMLATGSWTGLVWSIALIAIDTVIYYPFFKMYDQKKVEEEKQLALEDEELADDLI